RGRVRAGLVAASPAELASRLEALIAHLGDGGAARRVDAAAGVFFNAETEAARVGFLFPGQGSPAHADGGAWRRRFETVEELYARSAEDLRGDGVSTEVAQPAIVTASLAALRVLARLGVVARVAVGHSLGELTALHWAGALDEPTLLRTARERGRAMAAVGGPAGAMLSVSAGEADIRRVLNGDGVVVAGLNSPAQTILSGEAAAVASVARRFEARGFRCTTLRVSHAFHSPLVAPAVPRFAAHLAREEFRKPGRAVVSTVTGARLTGDEDLRALLCRQVTEPVRFAEAFREARSEGVDLWLEVGPGRALTGLAAESGETNAVALDACGPSLRGLLNAVAACFVAGANVDPAEMFAGRLAKPFNFDWRPRFFVNPCELAPADDERTETNGVRSSEASEGAGFTVDVRGNGHAPARRATTRPTNEATAESATVKATLEGVSHEATLQGVTDEATPDEAAGSPLELVRRLVAERAELSVSTVRDDSRLLDDLHLNSITVAQLVAEASRRLH
ncbi:MAG TPA: acyltransferase domain-containing protein, partial [Pyrinomonadaceae bacterium]|nr:acyltransferase domain-containing protein [Pyrinomonadaceae bacterium]